MDPTISLMVAENRLTVGFSLLGCGLFSRDKLLVLFVIK